MIGAITAILRLQADQQMRDWKLMMTQCHIQCTHTGLQISRVMIAIRNHSKYVDGHLAIHLFTADINTGSGLLQASHISLVQFVIAWL